MNHYHERGIALVMVLGLLALVSAWAIRAIDADSLALERAMWQKDEARARMGIESGVELAKALLKTDQQQSRVDHLDEAWAIDTPSYPVDDGFISVVVRDAGRYYNLNNLVRDGSVVPVELAAVKRLFRQAEIPEELAIHLADWMDADSQQVGSGIQEAGRYDNRPYRVKNAPLDRFEELLLIPGFEHVMLDRLSELAIVCPVSKPVPVNINTAPAEVIAAVADIALAEAEQVVEERQSSPFEDLKILKNRDRYRQWGARLASSRFAVNSEIFTVRVRSVFGTVDRSEEIMMGRESARMSVIYRQRVRPEPAAGQVI